MSLSGRYSEPVGAADVRMTEAGRADPLLSGFPDCFRVLLGHKEACDDVPLGAILLLTADRCPVQMIRVGRNVYATQFHPEADPGGLHPPNPDLPGSRVLSYCRGRSARRGRLGGADAGASSDARKVRRAVPEVDEDPQT